MSTKKENSAIAEAILKILGRLRTIEEQQKQIEEEFAQIREHLKPQIVKTDTVNIYNIINPQEDIYAQNI